RTSRCSCDPRHGTGGSWSATVPALRLSTRSLRTHVPADQRQPATDALTVLRRGEVEVQGRMPWSSNATFLATVSLDGVAMSAIYKPHRGERPLWDFPDGLYVREVAAYVLSEALGWELVPETILRDDLP